MIDPALRLYDPRLFERQAPTLRTPLPGEEAAYYKAGDGEPCPACEQPSPYHRTGCWVGPDFGPASRSIRTPGEDF